MNSAWPSPITGQSLAERFVDTARPTFGLEEEIMVLDPVTLDLLPRGVALLEGLDGRFKAELPAAHAEIASSPATSFGELARELGECRRVLAAHVGDRARLAVAGVHPFSSRFGDLNEGERYQLLLAKYGDVARQQLVCGLHLHLAVGGPDRTLAVYNALRSYLPEIAALAANAPIYDGRDTTLASVRPLLSGMLPRMGVPPALESFDEYASHLNWGIDANRMGRPAEWWWELRLHGALGTLEIRVPDGQTTLEDALAIGAVALGTALWLADRFDGKDLPSPVASWKINENRWSALHRGMDSTLIDLETGVPGPAAKRIDWLLDQIGPAAGRLGGTEHLSRARRIAENNGAQKQRELFLGSGARAVTEWLADRFLFGLTPG
ncbi:MAG TPA: YbdK family carboxylate-amine ligase [Actinomycetota bacterium]|nr:YbdK family carboxylate-amine ligase [Actinomycetota bacterium]